MEIPKNWMRGNCRGHQTECHRGQSFNSVGIECHYTVPTWSLEERGPFLLGGVSPILEGIVNVGWERP
eukprot:995444-Pelagomonas_calceolata.AAC.1